MKTNFRILIITTLVLSADLANSQNIGINTLGAAPNSSAGVDIDFSNKGLLIPRVALTSSTDAATITTPATGLIVYNPATGGLSPAGYYYNSGTSGSPVWVRLHNAGSPGTAWTLSGNTLTNVATDFFGTTDAQAVVFKTTGTERMRLLANGTLKFTGASTTSPGIWMESTVSAAAGTAYGVLSRGTLTAVANGDKFIPFSACIGTAATGTFTGLSFYGGHFDGATWAKTGTGTIDNGYGIYVTAPTIATNNYAAAFTGGNVGIGTAGPAEKLEVNGGNILVTNGSSYNGMLYSGDVNWGFKIQRTAATDDYNVRMSYWPASGTRRAGIYNANAANWVFYADQNVTPNIVMNNVTSVGIGTTTPDPNAALDIEKTTNRILGLFGNTNAITATDGITQAGVSVQARFSPSSSTTDVHDYIAYMDLAPPAGVTITNAYGLSVRGTQGGAGSVTNGYGIYVNMSPGFGTNKYAGVFLNGNVGIGTVTPAYPLQVVGAIYASGQVYCFGGGICSDARFKKDVSPINNSLEKILNLNGVYYYWNRNLFPDKNFPEEKQIGFIAQNVEQYFPELVSKDKDGYRAVDYARLTPILVEAMKEQQKIIDSQKKEIEELNNRFGVMENSLKAMELKLNDTAKKE